MNANIWTGAKSVDQGKYPAGFINTSKPDVKGVPNSKVEYTAPNGKPISKSFYNNEGLLEYQIDFRPHNMWHPHGHRFNIPGNFQNGHLPENHLPLMEIPLKYF